MRTIMLTGIIATVLITSFLVFNPVSAQEKTVPSWIKNTASFWVDGAVSDAEFLNAIEFLVNGGIIQVSNTPTDQKISSTPTYYVRSQTYAIWGLASSQNGLADKIRCNEGGDIAVSGGFFTDAPGVSVNMMEPRMDADGIPFGYNIGAFNIHPQSGGDARIYVTCMKVQTP